MGFGEKMKKGILKKGMGLGVACSLVLLIFAVLVPSVAAVRIFLGSPCDSSVFTGDTVTFNCVKLTIQGDEWDPVDDLEFVIYQCPGSQQVDSVRFSLCGVEICDPACRFSIVAVTDISNDFHHNEMCSHCTDKNAGCHDGVDFGYGYGYGYGDGCGGRIDLTILYHITYRTRCPGTYYAKLLVNSNCNTYHSESTSFTVSSTSSCESPVSPPPSCTQQTSCTSTNDGDYIADFIANCMNTRSHERSSVVPCGTDSYDEHQLDPEAIKLSIDGGRTGIRPLFYCWLQYVFQYMRPCAYDFLQLQIHQRVYD